MQKFWRKWYKILDNDIILKKAKNSKIQGHSERTQQSSLFFHTFYWPKKKKKYIGNQESRTIFVGYL